MRIVVALGGNALLRRDEPLTVEAQQANVELACARLAPLAADHELVVAHGNGPQIGLLALEDAAYRAADPTAPAIPLDVLGAETQGMIGYLVERELRNHLGPARAVATVLTLVEVAVDDPAFAEPTKPIGPRYDDAIAAALARDRGWTFRPDGDRLRRVVASPAPHRIPVEGQVAALLAGGCVVICAGGGGVPVAAGPDGRLVGVKAVVDKDHAGALLARDLGADLLVLATDTAGAYLGWGTATPRLVRGAAPDALLAAHGHEFAPGSMGPKVAAACAFASATGRPAVIGRLADLGALVAGTAGTCISPDVVGVATDADPGEEG